MVQARVVIAGVKSGSGKTTVAAGLMAALARRGLQVQGYKVGPDYIDPGYHTAVTGRPSRNLDSFLLPEATIRELYLRAAATANIGIIEGVMGLYDGRAGSGAGSTAEVARMLKAPVLLVLDAGSLAQSAAAMVMGYAGYDSGVHIAGVILNRVAGERHKEILQKAIEEATGIPVVGCLEREAGLALPSRHLGLTPAVEMAELDKVLDRLAHIAGEALDLDRIMTLAGGAEKLGAPERPLFAPQPVTGRLPVAIAHDAAFNFYYRDALDYLESRGACLLPFSPLTDARLPAGAAGLIIGGGFPEMFLPELAANTTLHEDIRRKAAGGLPLYAECGGLMYLCRAIKDFDDRIWPMAGLVPAVCGMQKRLAGMGYREAATQGISILGPAGLLVKGHEFHYSGLEVAEGHPWAYRLTENNQLEGYASGSVLASYIHLHWAGNPGAANNFLARCRAYARSLKK
ncbi:cobyrinate a,c-diamide synthase [Pelotomaculum terephthalicicum JT]|uniref:cobyrinate a,c-diamide synthase n=1 Tax=Pelotomaculum TaxID=191373 RepID=UPI0009C6299F|nr:MULTISPECIES: cobyrinate a,c-diamide synthase [Pelotomaculum]MCG9967320.1 cobyrinate a,c-diamide synthase [Pelotomaculum terephthalicicum JT]OPX89402.1 MAG: Cobyrinic acid A,C-diamide synthase [Pelotomaculum sp. PtaB.Bin117]OPY61785.1 MAG: Cobyrinic acid A,C-diamide synthase [Pelotomaculum sp. PtaU1.Bin065]